MDINEVLYLIYIVVNEYLSNEKLTVEDYWFENLLITFFKKNIELDLNKFMNNFIRDMDYYLFKTVKEDIMYKKVKICIKDKFRIRNLTKKIVSELKKRDIDIVKNI